MLTVVDNVYVPCLSSLSVIKGQKNRGALTVWIELDELLYWTSKVLDSTNF